MEQQFNFVYLRAKVVTQNEKEARALAQEACAKNDELDEQAKDVYRIGCGRFREKKSRDAQGLDLWEDELGCPSPLLEEEQIESLWNVLEKLPDMYFATVVAFYYDYMSPAEIGEVFGCTEGTVCYRLNYTRKCIVDELSGEHPFSPALVRMVLEAWFRDQNIVMEEEEYIRTITGRTVQDWAAKLQLAAPRTIEEMPQPEIIEEVPQPEVIEEVPQPKVKTEVPESIQADEEMPREKRKRGLAIGVALAVVAIGVSLIFLGGTLFEDAKDAVKPQDTATEQPTEDDKEEMQEDAPEEVPEEQPTEEPEKQETPAETYIFPTSNTVRLTEAELKSLTKAELRLARNEIYARHGVIFGVEDLDNYFTAQSWYTPKLSLSEFYETVEMNLIEEANVSLIKKVENER